MNKNKAIKKTDYIGRVVAKNPKIGDILIEKYGMFCVGCGAAEMETLEEGGMVHGMSGKKIDKMVEYLNKIISDKK